MRLRDLLKLPKELRKVEEAVRDLAGLLHRDPKPADPYTRAGKRSRKKAWE